MEGWKAGSDGFGPPKLADQRKTYIWTPPLMAAEVAVSEMRKARIMRQRACGVFVCPFCASFNGLGSCIKLPIVFEVPVGSNMWSHSMHEPLLIGILFPLISDKPWQLRGTPKMHAMGRQVRQVFIKEATMEASHLLRKFWICCVNLGLLESVVRKLLYFTWQTKHFHDGW